MGRLNLFDGGESPENDGSKIEINREFAKRYEHNKKREELQRYEELKKQGRVGSDSEDSSSDEEEIIIPSKKTDSRFFDALIKVKKQDPILMNKDAKLFDSGSEDDGDGKSGEKKEKKKKPMYLRNVIAKQLIEDGPEFDDEETEDEEDDDECKRKMKSYSEEQEDLRKEFLKAVEEEVSDDGDFLTVKNNASNEEKDEEIVGKLDEYFGEDEKLDENNMFLKDYFRNRMWIGDEKSSNYGDGIGFSEDEEEIEMQEDYERDFNFRYEENAGDRILGHSRKIDGSVRKKENSRKSQRERKEERMTQAEFERKEELKRLKNLKRKEIDDKLEKIREVAGIGKDEKSDFLDGDDLEEDFDPDAYDRKMKEAFGDNYYDAEDLDPGFGSDHDQDEDGVELEKPDFDKEDELLGLPKGWDDSNVSRDGFLSARERFLKEKENVTSENDDGLKESKRKRKRKPSEVENAVREELMEEYYKLDYEDTIGDLKTRFKYRPVKAKRFGLTPVEVLSMDDKDLNQYVSLKKIAPYREIEWKVPRIKTMQLKQKKKGDDVRKETKNNVKEKEILQVEGDVESSSRRAKRRHRQTELKLSRSRLMAYGKIPSKSKSKNQKWR